MARNRLSENEQIIAFALLFPIFWPFIPALLLCMAGEGIANRFRAWRWARQARKEENDRPS